MDIVKTGAEERERETGRVGEREGDVGREEWSDWGWEVKRSTN